MSAKADMSLRAGIPQAYNMPLDKVIHTSVVHQKKKVNGKWLKPKYTQRRVMELPDGQELAVVGGTQYVDGLWKHLRRHPGPAHGSDFDRINRMVRYGQWRLWIGATDPWRALLRTM